MTTLLERATQLFDKASEVLDRAIAERTTRETQVNTALNDLRANVPLMRLTPNASLIINDTDNGFLGWESIYAITAVELVERVSTGVPWADRSPRAQEFLNACGWGERQYFKNNFNIVRLRYSTASPTGDYLGGNHFQTAGAFSYGCIAKHESGVVPIGGYCNGLAAGESAKRCYASGIDNNPMDYTGYHPKIPTGSGSILVAMVQAVAGHVPDGVWGIYPYIAQRDVDGFRVYE